MNENIIRDGCVCDTTRYKKKESKKEKKLNPHTIIAVYQGQIKDNGRGKKRKVFCCLLIH